MDPKLLNGLTEYAFRPQNRRCGGPANEDLWVAVRTPAEVEGAERQGPRNGGGPW